MKILVIGGQSCGKTSLVARILNVSYHKLIESMNGLNNLYIHKISEYSLWDVPGNLLHATRSVHDYIFYSTDGVLLVVDSSSINGCDELLQWISILRIYISDQIPVILLANKSDSAKYVTASFLDQIISRFFFSGWYWTVGHMQYGDYDHRRGTQSKQLSVNEVITKLENLIIQSNSEDKFPDTSLNSLNPLFGSSKLSLTVDSSTIPHQSSGWEYYGGVMTREEAESHLLAHPNRKFLLRRSDVTFQLRIGVVNSDSTFSHILIKQIFRQEDEENSNNSSYISIGKKELKGMMFENLSDALFRGLNLNPLEGIKFQRILSNKGARYISHENEIERKTEGA